MTARDTIAAAMNTTALVNVTPRYRQSLKPFDGFVKFNQLLPASNRFGYMTSWQVWLAIPQDMTAAETWVEAHLTALTDAFNAVCLVSSVTPADLVLGDQAVNGLIFEGTRPAE